MLASNHRSAITNCPTVVLDSWGWSWQCFENIDRLITLLHRELLTNWLLCHSVSACMSKVARGQLYSGKGSLGTAFSKPSISKPAQTILALVQAWASEKGQKVQKCKSNLFFCPKLIFPKNQKVEKWQNLSKIVSFLHEFNHLFTYLLVQVGKLKSFCIFYWWDQTSDIFIQSQRNYFHPEVAKVTFGTPVCCIWFRLNVRRSWPGPWHDRVTETMF